MTLAHFILAIPLAVLLAGIVFMGVRIVLLEYFFF